MAIALEEKAPQWRNKSIHESSPDGILSKKIAAQAPKYTFSQYFPDNPPGVFVNGIRNEDLRQLTYADSCFDVFITQDVFEHVPDPRSAFREIHRVLKPGGLHIFTVPIYSEPTRERCRFREDGSIEHLSPPIFHGNPIDPNGSLVITDWGPDISEIILEATDMQSEIIDFCDPSRGLCGEFLSVVISRKR